MATCATILTDALAASAATTPRKLAFLQLLSLSGVTLDQAIPAPESIEECTALLELARTQGLSLLVHEQAIALLPESMRNGPIGAGWRAARMRDTRRNLALAAETMRVISVFEERGIRVIAFKGSVLSSIAFQQLAFRQPGDIDLLVQARDVTKAAAVLGELSYRSLMTRGPAWQAGHLGHDCEWEFVSPVKKIAIDLHWDFTARNFGLAFPVKEIWQRSRRITFAGKSIESFAPEDLVLILSVHAVKHYSQHLEWIFTIATLLRKFSNLDCPKLFANARRYGVLRHLRICLILASDLYKAPLPAEAVAETVRDPVARRLAVLVVQRIASGECEDLSKTEQRSFVSSTRIGTWAKICYWWAVITTPNQKDYSIELPRLLWRLYPLLRLVRLMTEALTPARRSAPAELASQS